MKIYEECKGAKSIAIGGHIRPDGDCVGACLAMKQYLNKRMPEAKVVVYLEKLRNEVKYMAIFSKVLVFEKSNFQKILLELKLVQDF